MSAREFIRGTLSLYNDLGIFTHYGITLPPLKAVINCLDRSRDAKEVVVGLYETFAQLNNPLIDLLHFEIPDRVAYREAATNLLPVHRHSAEQAENMRQLCTLLFPHWAAYFQV